MSTTRRLAGFGVALVAILGAGAGVGATVGPGVETVEEEAPAPIGQGVVTADAAAGTVIVESTHELDVDAVADAVDEAGYELAR